MIHHDQEDNQATHICAVCVQLVLHSIYLWLSRYLYYIHTYACFHNIINISHFLFKLCKKYLSISASDDYLWLKCTLLQLSLTFLDPLSLQVLLSLGLLYGTIFVDAHLWSLIARSNYFTFIIYLWLAYSIKILLRLISYKPQQNIPLMHWQSLNNTNKYLKQIGNRMNKLIFLQLDLHNL